MTSRIPENFSTVDWSLITITMPPRDPNDDDEVDEEDDAEREDEPAVIRGTRRRRISVKSGAQAAEQANVRQLTLSGRRGSAGRLVGRHFPFSAPAGSLCEAPAASPGRGRCRCRY
jgi:hypothetical protein